MKCCKNCLFKQITEEVNKRNGDALMRCRRYPPQTTTTDDSVFTEFPTVAEFEWCGEWRPDGDVKSEWDLNEDRYEL